SGHHPPLARLTALYKLACFESASRVCALHDLLATLDAAQDVAGPRIPVLLPVALDQTYDYVLPEGSTAQPGAFVLVPFGPQVRMGIVWDRAVGADKKQAGDRKLKAIGAVLADVPPLPVLSLRFAEWMARYTLSPLGVVARMMMGPSALFERIKPRLGVTCSATGPAAARMTPARKRVLQIAADGLIRAKSALSAQAQCSSGVIDGLIEAGLLLEVAIPERRFPLPNPAHLAGLFSAAQERAVHAMRSAIG